MRGFSVAVSIVVVALSTATSALAAPPVPLYTSHIVKKRPYSENSFILKTSDKLDVVTGFYRAHLTDMTTEHKDDQGSIFYTKSGATVTVSPDPVGSDTTISYSWDSKKYGPVPVRRGG